jgi:hypothetical protein
LTGTTYYRLKILDKNGSFSYSRVVAVNPRLLGVLNVYPNPAVYSITVSHALMAEKASLQLLSAEGRKIAQYTINSNTTQTSIDVSKLATGNYLLVMDRHGTITTATFMKQ